MIPAPTSAELSPAHLRIRSANGPTSRPTRSGSEAAVPKISHPLLGLFTWHAQHYVRRHFHSLRISRGGLPPLRLGLPTVIYSNHASWWDPLVGLMLKREFFPEKHVFVPMEAAALERYGFFKRIGAFGVELAKPRSAVNFLRQSQAILQDAANVLWLTPQARFADVRERPVQIKAGIAHLPARAGRVCFLPVAIEYVFWEERLPEVFVRFGQPYDVTPTDAEVPPQVWSEFFADQLRQTQDTLAADVLRRDPDSFRSLIRGRTGVGGIYDRWRAVQARLRGEKFRPNHGQL